MPSTINIPIIGIDISFVSPTILATASRKTVMLSGPWTYHPLSLQVNVDGSWVEMASDYPKVDATGPKTLFIFRFPKFTKDVLYDPTIELSDDGSSVSPTTQPGPSSTVKPNDSGANLRIEALPILMFLAALLKIFC